jgi:hypothetical protein
MRVLRRTLLGATAARAPRPTEVASLYKTVAANPQLGTFAEILRKVGTEA